jgi:hypothetical protein
MAQIGGWRRSAHCTGADSTCVEVRIEADGVAVRDAKDPAGLRLHFSTAEWNAFLAGARAGEFDP